MPTDPIRIKRYPNRRLFASHISSSISLPKIEEFVRSGGAVEIIDNHTGEDLTASVLMQFLADRHPKKIALFPAAMLHSNLRANDMMAGFLQDYFRHSLAYLDRFQKHGEARTAREPMHWMKAWHDNWSKVSRERPRSKEASSNQPAADDCEQMAARIAKFERRIVELEKKKTVPR